MTLIRMMFAVFATSEKRSNLAMLDQNAVSARWDFQILTFTHVGLEETRSALAEKGRNSSLAA